MNRPNLLVSSFALLGLALAPALLASHASAEGFLDLYLGASFPEDGNVDGRASVGGFAGGTIRGTDRIDYDTSFTSGLRGGYWFEDTANFIGIGLDLSYYGAYGEVEDVPRDIDFDVVALPITPLLMARIPIASGEDYPGGRVQPYAAIGPGLTLSVAYADLSRLGVGIDDLTAASFDVGLDVRGGLAIHIAKPIALFAEYRYTRLRPEYEDEVDFDFGPDIDIDLDPDLDVHHFVFGASFRF
jgi:opacity protein-like surface antigen